METRLKINKKLYKVLNNYSFKSSNSDVTFNNLTIDFTNCKSEDLPFKYQEVTLLQDNVKVFTGYVDTFKLSKLKTDNAYIELTLNLLSPLKLATRRCVSLIGSYDLKDAIKKVLQPLVDDGFYIEELNVPTSQITTSFVIETIENAMNSISSKRNLFWYIDENKNIKVNSIDYLFGKNITRRITTDYEKGLLELQPTISNIDYANIINFKNVRLIYSNINEGIEYNIVEENKVIKKGDTIQFINPIIFDKDTLTNRVKEFKTDYSYLEEYYMIDLEIQTSSGNKVISIKITKDFEYIENHPSTTFSFSTDGDEEAEIVFERDPFFNELITGFKWNVNANGTIIKINSDIALRYTTMRFMHSNEIEKLKGIISDSGQIEKTIDFESKWIDTKQLIDYSRSIMQQNSNVVNEVSLQYDINPNLKIGDIIEINRPNFFINGKFAVKSINYTYNSELKQIWKVVVKSTDLISSYIDLFRPTEKQESTNTINTIILSEYIEENIIENITESEVVSNED